MVGLSELPQKYTKEQLKQMIDSDSLPPALKETFEECRIVIKLMEKEINAQIRKPKRMGSGVIIS